MDRLFSRYADPFPLLNGYIQTGRFCEFIGAFCERRNEDDRWEYYLHKVWDKSYRDFCASMETPEPMSESEIEATVKDSMSILKNFNPQRKEGEL